MDNLNESDWQIDRSKGLATHKDGFVAEMYLGQVRNIVRLPPGIAARDISRYVSAAEKAWGAAPSRLAGSRSGDDDGDGPSAIAKLIGHGLPRRPKVKPPEAEREPEPVSVYLADPAPEKPKKAPTIRIKRRRKLEK